MNDRMRVATKLRELRLKAGLSLLRLAGLSGFSLSTIQVAEKAGRITENTAERLAEVLKCKPADLLPKSERGGK